MGTVVVMGTEGGGGGRKAAVHKRAVEGGEAGIRGKKVNAADGGGGVRTLNACVGGLEGDTEWEVGGGRPSLG